MSEGLSVLYAPEDACIVAVMKVRNTIFVPPPHTMAYP